MSRLRSGLGVLLALILVLGVAAPARAQAPTILTTGACPTATSGFALNPGAFCFQIPAKLLFVWDGSIWASTAGSTFNNPTITGTVAGGATYNGITLDATSTLAAGIAITSPALSGTATGTYTLGGTPTIAGPTLSGTVLGTYTLGGTPTISAATVAGSPALSGAWTFNGGITQQIGTSGVAEGLASPLFVNSTSTGNAAATTETDLHTFPLTGNSLVTDNDFLVVHTIIQNAANGNAKRTRVYFGATVIGDSTQTNNNNDLWDVWCHVFRTGAATQKAQCVAQNIAFGAAWNTGNAGGANLTTPAETLSGAVTIKVTGQSPVTGAANDVTAIATTIVYYRAP